MAKIKVTKAMLKAIVKNFDGRKTWSEPVTVEIDGNTLQMTDHIHGEILQVTGIIPTENS